MVTYEKLSKLKPKKSLPHHPYFTTQPVNIIREYIKSFTKVNDIVLDPFCGTGTTAIAASIEGRQAISYDLSPMSVFISKNSISKVDLEKAKDTFGKIKEGISEKIIKTYTGKFTSTSAHHPEISLPKSSDAKNIKELFTERNLSNLTLLRDRILSEKDSSIRDFFLLVFSGMLHRASKTFFYDKANWGGGNSSIFTKFRYWIPSKPAERNVWELFEIRFNRVIKIKEKLQTQLKGKVEIKEGTATKLTEIDSETIDYVYTDPPYGANIAYLDLSKMWIAWLNLNRKSRNEQEIIEGGSLGNSRAKYLELMGNAIKEIHRVLKPNKTFSLVFQHKDPKLWSSLVELCEKNGFEYINMFFYNSFYQTFHKNKNPLNLISGQLIINFKKKWKNKII